MQEETSEQRKAIEDKVAIEDLINSRGWKILEPIIKMEIEDIEAIRGASDDPNVVLSCVRREDGIKFIQEVMEQIIARGIESIRQSDK